MQIIPLKSSPNQSLTTVIDGRYLTISLRTLTSGLYFDLLIDQTPIVQSVLCLNGVRLIRGISTGYSGDFMFVDTEGNEDPSYLGLGGRFALVAI